MHISSAIVRLSEFNYSSVDWSPSPVGPIQTIG